jgi:hypothetical protein
LRNRSMECGQILRGFRDHREQIFNGKVGLFSGSRFHSAVFVQFAHRPRRRSQATALNLTLVDLNRLPSPDEVQWVHEQSRH